MYKILGNLLGVFKSDFQRAMFLILTGMIGIGYAPAFAALFHADDFNFLSYLYRYADTILNGQLWNEWFIGGIVNFSVFRPMGSVYWLLNYVAFGMTPLGYHVATLLLHLIATIAVFLLTKLLTHDRLTAGIAAILFAVMPVHAEAVTWVAASYDVMSGMYFFVALIFYFLYRQRQSLRFYLISLGAFAFALSSKETAITLPVIFIMYDCIHDGTFYSLNLSRMGRVLAGYIPFGILFATRFLFFGQGYRGLALAPEGLVYSIDTNLLRVFSPLPEISFELLRGITLASVAILALAIRSRWVFFSLVWIPITAIPTLVGGVTDRSFYIPSYGIALAIALVLAALLKRKTRFDQVVGIVALLLVVSIYGLALVARNQSFVRAGQVAKTIIDQIESLHPTVPPEAHYVFVGMPGYVPNGPAVFAVGFPDALTLLYQNHPPQLSLLSKFPIWLDDISHLYFFQIDHARVVERADLVASLQARKSCSTVSQPAVTWTFAQDTEGWEPWNQLEDFGNGNGALVARSVGDDPFMASPVLDVPALSIGDIEITMRVATSSPTFDSEIYWLASGQSDFSPGLKQSFSGKADGEYHTYQVDITRTGMLLLGDHITRLRFDPMTTPGDISIKSIQIDTHCDLGTAGKCACEK